MRLTIIGCSGSFPGPDSPASCYLVDTEHEGRTWRILLDLGSGALGALHRYADPLGVDAVLLSHLHPDHCSDIAGYYVMRKYHPDGPQPRIPVFGPRGTAKRMATSYGLPAQPGMNKELLPGPRRGRGDRARTVHDLGGQGRAPGRCVRDQGLAR